MARRSTGSRGGRGAGAAGRAAGRDGAARPRTVRGASHANAASKRASRPAADTTVTKVDSRFSPRGPMGQTYLAAGVRTAMRLWRARPGEAKPAVAREYETVGFVLRGRAELVSEGQTVLLRAGDSWVVPRGALHTYRIIEPLIAIEATSPPAPMHGREESPPGSGGQSERA